MRHLILIFTGLVLSSASHAGIFDFWKRKPVSTCDQELIEPNPPQPEKPLDQSVLATISEMGLGAQIPPNAADALARFRDGDRLRLVISKKIASVDDSSAEFDAIAPIFKRAGISVRKPDFYYPVGGPTTLDMNAEITTTQARDILFVMLVAYPEMRVALDTQAQRRR